MSCESGMNERRHFLRLVATGGLALGCASSRGARGSDSRGRKDDEEISPTEDLMREHGVLERLLLVYEESARRLETSETLPPDVVGKAAGIVRRFIEDYHERLEEEFLFPRFEAAQQTDLVPVLRAQHDRGRAMTDLILAIGSRTDDRARLAQVLRAFSRMYRPHAAREDTMLFPAFRRLVDDATTRELGAAFEKREHDLFGESGFESVVREVAALEQALGIYDLSQFTTA
jgi:hemerythrin-like domain-containing protein